MKHVDDLDNIPTNYYTRTSRNKCNEGIIISKIEDYQTSMTTFSTKLENKINIDDILNKNKEKKRVQFNPLITVINIESYKKENYYGPAKKSNDNNDDSNKIKKCISCNIF